jgi:hypothetical protein
MARATTNDSEVPIGRPIANTQVYILDPNLQPVPIGVPGEIYISGDGLAREYLNRSELTAEKFLCNPFKKDPGSRLYHTGDRAKYRANGNIEFLGRSDNQVKIRGHRIELGEIETVLNQHHSVKEAVVVARVCDASKENKLAAYIVVNHEPTPTVAELRGFLQKRLPEFMIPSLFIFLNQLPMTPNGKVDRQALPPPDGERRLLDSSFVEPRTEIEELVAQIWRELLKRDRIGVYDNFFELGGHSLLAIQVVSRICGAVRVVITVRDLFEAPTVLDLAAKINAGILTRRNRRLPRIKSVPRDCVYPLLASQTQLWQMDQLFPGTLFLNMPYVYQLKGHLDAELLRRSLQEIVRRHDAFRMIFREDNGRVTQRVGSLPVVKLPHLDLRHLSQLDAEAEFEKLATHDAALPFNLETGPVFRFTLVHLTENHYRLLVTVHHIISDHWSMQIFRREMAVLYDAFVHGNSPNLPRVRIQFLDFISWQRLVLKRGLLRSQVSYWRRRLAGPPTKLVFDNNWPRKAHLSLTMSTKTFEVSEQVFTDLRGIALTNNCTLFMLLLAILNIVIWRHTGLTDVRFGATVSNRAHRELENTIGHLVNCVTLRTRFVPGIRFKSLLNRVKAVALGAFANQEVPFGSVARALQKKNPGVRNRPLFEMMLIYHNVVSHSV